MTSTMLGLDGPHQLPPLRALLDDGPVPCSATLDLYINDLDSQLEDNTKELDSCLKSIVKFTNDLPGSKSFTAPKEGLSHMLNSHVLEKDSCYDPEIEDVTAILSYLHKTLEQCPKSEEAVLQEVLALSSQEGLMLPLRTSGLDSAVMSMTSLNVVLDSCDQMIEQKWNKIAQHLKKYFVGKLLELPLTTVDIKMNVVVNQRLKFLQSLRAIAQDEDVWIRYRSLRTQQLEQCFNKMLPDSQVQHVNYKNFTKNCDSMANIIVNMINEDFVVLNTGMFRKVTGVFKALHDLYLEKYSDEMSLLVEEICDEINEARFKSFSQSQSEVGIHSNHVGELQKGQAQSLDSMMTASGVQANAEQRQWTFPEECIQSLLQILLSIMKIEDHIAILLKNTSWDVAGMSGKQKKRKGSLRGVLKPSSSPEPTRHSLNLGGLCNSDTNLESSGSSSLISLPGHTTPAPRVIERTRTEDRLHWDWKLILKKISGDLSHAIEAMLHGVMRSSLELDLRQWETRHGLQTSNVDKALQGGKLDYPKIISKSVKDFFDVADLLLPLARAGIDGALHPARAAYVDIVSLAVKNFHVHFTKLSKDIPGQVAVSSLHVILASATYIRNHLVHYEKVLVLEEAAKKPFTALFKQFVELVDAFSKQVVTLHNQLIQTSVFHDAESGNWADMKDFYEDERCSFTVQMWNYHLKSLQHDLWMICPPHAAQTIFSTVLNDSLMTITQRYVRIKPSFRRVKQFRYDLTSVLLCTEEFLFRACNSMSQFLDPGHCDLPHYNIHNICSTQLAVMAVVSSPIDVLYRVFKRGYGRRRESDDDFSLYLATSYHGSNTQWLHWIRPTLFHPGQKHFDDMQTTTALYLQLNLLLKQPDIDWGKLVQALIMKDYTLPIILMTRCIEVLQPSAEVANQTRAVSHHTESPVVAQEKMTAMSVFQSIVNILALCQHFPDAVAKVLLPVIDRCDDWEILNIKGSAGADIQPPIWMKVIFTLLEPLTHRVIEPVLEYLINLPTATAELDPVITKIHELPCGCIPAHRNIINNRKPPALKCVVETALKTLIMELAQSIYMLTPPICALLNLLQDTCKDRKLKTGHSCVGLQLIALHLKITLQDIANIEKMTGLQIHPEMQQHLMLLGDCVYHVLVYGKAKGSNTPRLAGKFSKTHKEWVADKIQTITGFLMNEIFYVSDSDILEAATTAFSDQLFVSLASNILDMKTGYQDLLTVYHLIQNNQQWLFQQLDVRPLVSRDIQAKSAVFQLDITSKNCEDFVPAEEFSKIGDNLFDHEFISSFPYNWSQILQSDLGLSEHGFKSLLYNRHELQDGAYLEENERKPVEVLKTVFENEAAELG